jgi:ribonuclease HI
MTYKAFFDGSAQPNPGKKKIGGTIYAPNGMLLWNFTEETGHGTNNEAEYEALERICEFIKNNNIRKVDIKGDSMLVVNQVNGKWKCNKPSLLLLKDKILKLLKGITFTLTHVPREQNTEADILSKKGS